MGVAASQFPYRLGAYRSQHGVWALHDAERKADQDQVSLFVFDRRSATSDSAARASRALMRLKTLRYPHIIRFIDSAELPDSLYVVTERVSPFVIEKDGLKIDERTIPLGLFQIASAIGFLNNDCKLSHNLVCPTSIFLSRSGDWKLGSMDSICEINLSSATTDAIQLANLPKNYWPPEIAASKYGQRIDIQTLDSWSFACLIYETFNGCLDEPKQLTNTCNIPAALLPQYKRLLATKPQGRLNAIQVLQSTYFETDIVKTADFLDQLTLKSPEEKEAFFRDLPDKMANIPDSCAKYRLLPCLLSAMEFGGGSGSGPRVLSSIIQISRALEPAEFRSSVQPIICKQFASNDRAIRASLLKYLPDYIEHLPDKLVNDELFTHIVTGFTDTEPRLREATVKAMIYLLPKLKERTVQTLGMPMMSKMQRDPVPGIRCNTIIAIGKASRHLSATMQQRTLAPACFLALRDPFIPSRKSALAALQAMSKLFNAEQSAKVVLPGVCPHLLDQAKDVREESKKTIQVYLNHISELTEGMPDEKQIEDGEIAAVQPSVNGKNSQDGAFPKDLSSALSTASSFANRAAGFVAAKIVEQKVSSIIGAKNSTSQQEARHIGSDVRRGNEQTSTSTTASVTANQMSAWDDFPQGLSLSSRAAPSFTQDEKEDNDPFALYSLADHPSRLSPSPRIGTPLAATSQWDDWLDQVTPAPVLTPLPPPRSHIPPPAAAPRRAAPVVGRIVGRRAGPMGSAAAKPQAASKDMTTDDFFNNW